MSYTEEDYKRFFDEAPLALFRTDLVTGKFLMANRFAASLLGCESVEDLLQKKATDFYPKVTRARLMRKLKKTGTLQNHEVELVLPDGKKLWVRAHMTINCGGTCIECFLQDITEFVVLRDKELIKMKVLSDKIDVRMATLAS